MSTQQPLTAACPQEHWCSGMSGEGRLAEWATLPRVESKAEGYRWEEVPPLECLQLWGGPPPHSLTPLPRQGPEGEGWGWSPANSIVSPIRPWVPSQDQVSSGWAEPLSPHQAGDRQ